MSANLPEIRLALSDDFLDAFAALPKRQQGRVRQFMDQFRRNPTAPGLNYELIRDARDPNLRSVRIDVTYRAIVLKPERGNIYALLWVDHHDEAYAWARNRRARIDEATGALQIIPVVTEAVSVVEAAPLAPPRERPSEAVAAAAEPSASRPPSGLFDAIPDEVLARFGLPEEFYAAVRELTDEAALDALQPQLPDEVYEALFYLVAGYTPDEVWKMISGGDEPAPLADPTDFEAAFENVQTLRRFTLIADDADLQAILNAPLAKWRIFLHPSQRRLVTTGRSGPARVLGGAGTGKTVVAMHRARYLAEKVFTDPTHRILFTTFTANLATDIQANLDQLCPVAARSRIEVVHFDQWVRDFLAREGFAYTVVYDDHPVRREAWKQAESLAPVGFALPETFYREEFERVILPQGITDQAGYFGASRVGRGTALGRRDRAAVWSVFENYRRQLADAKLIEIGDAMREARLLLAARGDILPYRAVVVDEAQDLGPQAFMLLRQIVPSGENDMFIVGDAHQRIYRQHVVLSRCGVNVVGRSAVLKINYRTTDEIRGWAVRLVAGQGVDDLDGGLDETRGYKSLLHGNAPEVRPFRTAEDELAFLTAHLKAVADDPKALKATCLVARTNKQVDSYEARLSACGLATFKLLPAGDDPRKEGVRLASMHRVKGLEFDRIIVAGVNEGVMPLAIALRGASDVTSEVERDLSERSLLYVAVTRAKRHALITSYGRSSPFLAAEVT